MNTKYFYNFSSKLPLLTSLILFAILLLSSVAQGQAQHASVTVGNGQESNQYVPIYLDNLPAGIYMMAVRTSRGIVNKRVVVK